jgi:deoxycytidylate deaminase
MAKPTINLPPWLHIMRRDALSETVALAGIINSAEHRLKQKTIGHIAEAQETGDHFERNILHYIHGLDAIKEDVEPLIQEVALHITGFLQAVDHSSVIHPAQMPRLRGPLWVGLSSAIEPLGGRPSKKVGSLLTDRNDDLVSWDVNHLCPGIEPSARLFVKSKDNHRGHHLFCAERNTIASFLGLSVDISATDDIATIHAGIDSFTEKLTGAAAASKELRQHNLVSSHCPCAACAKVVAPEKEDGTLGRAVKSIYTQWNHGIEAALSKPDRKTADALEMLRRAGIHVSLHRPGGLIQLAAA